MNTQLDPKRFKEWSTMLRGETKEWIVFLLGSLSSLTAIIKVIQHYW